MTPSCQLPAFFQLPTLCARFSTSIVPLFQ
nr:MAG TPA: hypothetical protein [Caudoviricetes sp.]